MEKFIKNRAKILRKNGYSFREIAMQLNISKSTAGLWTRGEILNVVAKKRIRDLKEIGLQKAKATNKNNRENTWKKIATDCSVLKSINNYGVNEYKIFLALLYWGEGSKSGSRLIFTNSDELMIRIYLSLLRRSFEVDNSRFKVCLHLHEYHSREEMIDFWSKLTAIPKKQFSVYNKPHTGKNKKKGYKGCLSIRYGSSRILKEVFIIIKRMRRII